MIKKLMAILLTLSLSLVGATALGETTSATVSYSGKVQYRQTMTITAPFGGKVEDFNLLAGDTVTAGETLFTLTTTKVYAPFDGTVRGLRAQAGDDASTIIDRYGALAYLEPTGKYTVSATTGSAYKSDNNNNINRYLNEGETVYLRCTSDDTRTGMGIITKVDGRNFEVEVQQSNLDIDDNVNIYRDAAFATAHRIGSNARVVRAASTGITADGSILRCAVADGDSVKRGDLLFEVVTGTLDNLKGISNVVTAPVDGVLVSIEKTAGSTVQQNDVLATYYAQDALCVEFDVDESELAAVQVGANVKVTQDAQMDAAPLEGTVESISAISADSGDAKYTAYVKLTQTDGLRVGMNVSLYLQ